ncbi:MAG: hypothetical protein JXR13_20035, partial [Thalassovita sp.]
MIALLSKLLTGGLIDQLSRAYAARHSAKTEQERIAASVTIAQLEERQANRALGGRLTAIVQAVWAAPFILYNAKLVVWDKVLGLGATDLLSADLMAMQLRIATFYFGGNALVGVVRAV